MNKLLEKKIKEDNSTVTDHSKLIPQMREWFKKYNELLWDSKLKEPTTYNIFTSKLNIGQFVVDTNGVTTIRLSSHFNFPLEVYESVFVHEMIHLYEYQVYGDFGHGHRFNRELKRINRLLPFEVKAKENAKNLDSLNRVKHESEKLLGVILESDGTGYGLCLFDEKYFTPNRDKINEIVKKHLGVSSKILKTGYSSYKNLSNIYKVKRSMSRLEFYSIDEKIFKDIEKTLRHEIDLKK